MKDGRDKNYVRCKIEGTRTLLDERWKGQKLCSMKDGRENNSARWKMKDTRTLCMELKKKSNSSYKIKHVYNIIRIT